MNKIKPELPGCNQRKVLRYADIRNSTLLDVLKRPIFMAYHDGQPFNDNMLRSCPMLENPECLREMVKKSEAQKLFYGEE